MPEVNYTRVGTTPSNENEMAKEPSAINDGIDKKEGSLENHVVITTVDSIDGALKSIQSRMGTVAIGNMGLTARSKDSGGNMPGLFQSTGQRI